MVSLINRDICNSSQLNLPISLKIEFMVSGTDFMISEKDAIITDIED